MATAEASPRGEANDAQGKLSPRGSSAGSDLSLGKTSSGIGGGLAQDAPSDSTTADYREDIVRSIFGEVGTPVEDFSCAVESRILLHGRMYVTNTFVCFYSNLFGFEKIIKIPFCHMRCITKEKTALFIPNAIAIITSKKEYIFRSFWDREDAFKTLKQCQQDSSLSLTQQDSLSLTQQHSASLAESSPTQQEALDLSSTRATEDLEQSQGLQRFRRTTSIASHGSLDSGGGSDEDEDKDGRRGSRSGEGVRRTLVWSARESTKPPSGEGAGGEGQQQPQEGHEDNDLCVPGLSSNDASTRSLFGQSPSAAAPAADTLEAVPMELPPPSPIGGVEEQTAEGVENKAEADGDVPVDGSGRGRRRERGGTWGGEGGEGVGGEANFDEEAGVAVSDENDSEVDVLGVEGSPVTAVSLGSTTGGGKAFSKGQDFEMALTALGEGWLLGGGGGAGEGQQSDRRTSKGATSRISTEIPCQLQEFFQLFISNEAEKGIPAFHESQGDSDVQATPWKMAGGALGMTREIRFVHPVSAPIGPRRTRAVKLQRCRLYDEHGLILETSMHLEDIMMSDYFQIDDRCVVQPGQDGAVRVDVEVEIKFFKSTMFRKTIETKSLNETMHVWESFIAMTRDAIQKRKPALHLRTPSGGDDSDEEGRIQATRERLRERRKHRHRTRHHPPPHGHPPDELPSRPRAKSAASTVTPRALAQDAPPRKRGDSGVGVERKRVNSGASAGFERKRGNSAGGRGERKLVEAATESGAGGPVLVTPVPSLRRWFLSFAALPWLLLAVVFLVEAIELLRFSSETRGFLEAAEMALTVLGTENAQEAEEEGERVAGDGTARAVLTEELARGLMRIYSRHRFLWPFSRFY